MPRRKAKPLAENPCLRQTTLGGIELKACPRGTPGCAFRHDGTDPEPTYADKLKAWNERVKAGEHHTKFTGD